MDPSLRQRLQRFLVNLYPPFLGAGVRVRRPEPDVFLVEMKLRWWNQNYVGTHFGGSLYTMCDPFYMLLLLEALGSEYLVWDKAATIRFKRPGKGPVRARFHIPPETVQEIRQRVEREGKMEPVFTVEVLNRDDQVVAEVEKRLWVKRKAPRDDAGATGSADRG